MGSYIYSVRSKTVNVKKADGSKMPVRLAMFLCRNESGWDIPTRQEKLVNSAQSFYEKKGIAPFIVMADDTKDLEGLAVYSYNRISGTFVDDWNIGDTILPIGTIMGKQRAYHLETREWVIEKHRRQKEWTAMEKGILSIGEFN